MDVLIAAGIAIPLGLGMDALKKHLRYFSEKTRER